jgi:hypothetical protein
MSRAILITVLILSIFQIGGCVVISCEERMHGRPPHVKCLETDLTVHEVLVIGF